METATMKTITVPTYDQVSPGTQQMFDTLKARMGKVPNLYAAMGYSENALKAFMALDEALVSRTFRAKEREAIALVVSQVNECAYCLAGHTMAALKFGLSKEETFDARRGQMADARLNAIVRLAKSVAENKGHAGEAFIEDFCNQGFNEGALMELIGLVALRVYTNYAFALTQIPVDFPAAEPLP